MEDYARYKLADHLGVNVELIEHPAKLHPSFDYDLKYKEQRFDVKYSNPVLTSSQKTQRVWEFDSGKGIKKKRVSNHRKYCDFFLCIGFLRGIPDSIFLIPFEEAPTRKIRISIKGVSKYHQYKI